MNMMFKLVITFQDLYGSSSYLQILSHLRPRIFLTQNIAVNGSKHLYSQNLMWNFD